MEDILMQKRVGVQTVDYGMRLALFVMSVLLRRENSRVPILISCGISAPHCSSSGRNTCAIQNAVSRASRILVASGSLVKKLLMRRASGTWKKEAMGSLLCGWKKEKKIWPRATQEHLTNKK